MKKFEQINVKEIKQKVQKKDIKNSYCNLKTFSDSSFFLLTTDKNFTNNFVNSFENLENIKTESIKKSNDKIMETSSQNISSKSKSLFTQADKKDNIKYKVVNYKNKKNLQKEIFDNLYNISSGQFLEYLADVKKYKSKTTNKNEKKNLEGTYLTEDIFKTIQNQHTIYNEYHNLDSLSKINEKQIITINKNYNSLNNKNSILNENDQDNNIYGKGDLNNKKTLGNFEIIEKSEHKNINESENNIINKCYTNLNEKELRFTDNKEKCINEIKKNEFSIKSFSSKHENNSRNHKDKSNLKILSITGNKKTFPQNLLPNSSVSGNLSKSPDMFVNNWNNNFLTPKHQQLSDIKTNKIQNLKNFDIYKSTQQINSTEYKKGKNDLNYIYPNFKDENIKTHNSHSSHTPLKILNSEVKPTADTIFICSNTQQPKNFIYSVKDLENQSNKNLKKDIFSFSQERQNKKKNFFNKKIQAQKSDIKNLPSQTVKMMRSEKSSPKNIIKNFHNLNQQYIEEIKDGAQKLNNTKSCFFTNINTEKSLNSNKNITKDLIEAFSPEKDQNYSKEYGNNKYYKTNSNFRLNYNTKNKENQLNTQILNRNNIKKFEIKNDSNFNKLLLVERILKNKKDGHYCPHCEHCNKITDENLNKHFEIIEGKNIIKKGFDFILNYIDVENKPYMEYLFQNKESRIVEFPKDQKDEILFKKRETQQKEENPNNLRKIDREGINGNCEKLDFKNVSSQNSKDNGHKMNASSSIKDYCFNQKNNNNFNNNFYLTNFENPNCKKIEISKNFVISDLLKVYQKNNISGNKQIYSIVTHFLDALINDRVSFEEIVGNDTYEKMKKNLIMQGLSFENKNGELNFEKELEMIFDEETKDKIFKMFRSNSY